MIRPLFRPLLLACLGVAGCASTELPQGVPLTPEEIEYQRSLESFGEMPSDDTGKAKLMIELDKTLNLWHVASIEKLQVRQREMVANLTEVLQVKVYTNFDVVLEMLLQGSDRHRAIAAAALGFSRLEEPADPAARDQFLDQWPQKYPRAVPHLTAALLSEDYYLRHNALLGLAQIGDPSTPLPAILDTLKSEDEAMRSMAAYALSRVVTVETAPTAMAAILDALNDPAPKVRLNAVAAARATRSKNTIGTLARLLAEDPHIEIQRNAAVALGEIGDWRSSEFLILRLSQLLSPTLSGERREVKDLDARRRHLSASLIDSLERLSGKTYGDDLDDWMDWWADRSSEA